MKEQMELSLEMGPHHPAFADLLPEVVERFFVYHRANPHIYESFKKYAGMLRAAGRDYHSSAAIIERIRWDTLVSANSEQFKINNSYRPCYSRMLMVDDPSFKGFFRTRHTPGTVPIEEIE